MIYHSEITKYCTVIYHQYGGNYLENPKAASFHRYFRSAAAPASGNMAFTL